MNRVTDEPRAREAPASEMPDVHPLDEHNRKLLSHVHPPDWINPKPAARYNLVVIGAGAGGLVSSIGTASLGGKVALIERNLLGGDCLNVGCVPSKALIRSSRAAADVKRAGELGVRVDGNVSVDFSAVMERMRRLRARISPNDSVQRLQRDGVDLFLGHGRFTSPDSVEVAGKTLRFSRAIIATGGRPIEPPIDGLREAGFLTNETLFNLTQLPPRLAIIGGGPIGCEMAQAFARFGSKVYLLEAGPQILAREDRDAAAIIEHALQRDGVDVSCNCNITRVRVDGGDQVLSIDCQGTHTDLHVDEILVSAGRAPNVEGLGLEAAGVDFDTRNGVKVDKQMRTTNRRIFAVGDVCFPYRFTHASDATARIAIRNALFFGRSKSSDLVIPWCTYTDPEIAHTGMYAHEAKARGIDVETIQVPLSDVDRAIVDGEDEGFLKLHHHRGRILGATLVARHAGEMISQLTLAIAAGASLGTIANTIHPYPTQAEVIRKAADTYNRSRLTPRVASLLRMYLSWRR